MTKQKKSPYFDSCPICQAMRRADEAGKELTMDPHTNLKTRRPAIRQRETACHNNIFARIGVGVDELQAAFESTAKSRRAVASYINPEFLRRKQE